MYSVFVLSHIEVFVSFPGLVYNCVGRGEPYCIHLFIECKVRGSFLKRAQIFFDMFIIFMKYRL